MCVLECVCMYALSVFGCVRCFFFCLGLELCGDHSLVCVCVDLYLGFIHRVRGYIHGVNYIQWE